MSASGALLRVGIVGCGANSLKAHVPGLRAAGATIVALANRTVASTERAMKEAGLTGGDATARASWREVCADRDVDAVMVGTWPDMHAAIVEEALMNGKHVLTEARMAMNVEEARRMLQVSRRNPHLTTMIVPSPFTLEFDTPIKRLLHGDASDPSSEPAIGQLLSVDVQGCTPAFVGDSAPVGLSVATWRQLAEHSGHNLMMMGIFYEALQRWIGEAESVSAMGRVVVPLRRASAEADAPLVTTRIPDHLDILAKFVNGAQCRMQFSSVQGAMVQPNHFTLYGTKGTLRLELGKPVVLRIALASENGVWRDVSPEEMGPKSPGWRVEEEFVKACRGEEKVKFTTFEDGVRYMNFTTAVNEALRTGKNVTLPNPFAG